jgi:hypothetical protein
MENVKNLLDEAKEKTGSGTDYALAKTLDLPRARIHDYYAGNRFPDEFACLKIAEATGRTFEEVTALVKLEAEKNEKRREVWRKRLVSIGGIAGNNHSTSFCACHFENDTRGRKRFCHNGSKWADFVLCQLIDVCH